MVLRLCFSDGTWLASKSPRPVYPQKTSLDSRVHPRLQAEKRKKWRGFFRVFLVEEGLACPSNPFPALCAIYEL